MAVINKLNSKTRKKVDTSPLIYGKMPPQAPDLETAVLGAIMLEPSCLEEVLDIIPSHETFYSDANQRIYACIQQMYNRGSRIDFMTVCEELRKCNELEMVGGSYYVTSLTRDVVSRAHIEEHARIVVQKYITRELIRLSGEVISDAYEDSTDTFDLLDQAGSNIEDLALKQIRKDYRHISSGASKVLQEVNELQQRTDALSGVPSGFYELDKSTGGWQPTDLIILAARPSVGKTAFALNLLLNAILNEEKPTSVIFFSLEMSEKQIIKRIAANYLDLFLDKILKGKLNNDELQKFNEGIYKIKNLSIYIDDTAGINSHELRIKVKKARRKHGVGLVIIDYLQLMSGSGQSWSREQEVSKISRDLKGLAKELEIPVIALSQLNRQLDTRGSDRAEPKLSDLRETGAIEQDADVVMFLYKPKDSQGETCLSIAKHRNGSTGKFGIMFDGGKQRFSQLMNLDQDTHYPVPQQHTYTPPQTNNEFVDDDPF